MNLIGREWSELSALFVKNCYILLCLHSIICKYRPISTKLGQNIYVQQDLNEFDHGSNWTGATGTFALELGKIKPICTKLGHNVYEHKISDELDYGLSHTRSVSVICP